MDRLTQKTYTTSRNLTYTYYNSAPSADKSRPTLLLQHGFPDDHNLWAKIIPSLLELPYAILTPDLLGYNGTSKPTEASLYNSKDMSQDLIEILDHEGIQKIVSVGHDWGSFMAQRMYLWHPDRVVGVILLNVSYMTPGPFDLAQANEMTEKFTGFPRLAYWELLTADDGAQILNNNLESALAGFYGAPENWMEKMLCVRGALRDFIINDKRVELMDYAKDPTFKETWLARYKRDGFEAPVQWYFASKDGHQWAVEKDIPQERLVIKVPLLFVGATGDSVCRTAMIYEPQKAGLLPDLVVKEVTSGHWQPYEVPEKTSEYIVQWLKGKDFK
jgi:soluble epoxide hydrolase/lipid-phosphate phosphatase